MGIREVLEKLHNWFLAFLRRCFIILRKRPEQEPERLGSPRKACTEGDHMRRIGRRLAAAACAAVLTAAWAVPAWAGTWQQDEDGGWRYEEDGVWQTGWVQVDGIWYDLDAETGVWIQRPPVNRDTVCYLVENAVTRAGWYEHEDREMVYQVESVEKNRITVALKMETAPFEFTETAQVFEVSLRDKTAKAVTTKLVLDLYG